MKKVIRNICLFLLTVGWLVPLGMSFSFFNSWLNKIVIPKINNTVQEMHSFPSLQASESTFTVSFWWLCLAVTSWTAYFLLYKPFREK